MMRTPTPLALGSLGAHISPPSVPERFARLENTSPEAEADYNHYLF